MDAVIATFIQCWNLYLELIPFFFDANITTLHQGCASFAKNVKCWLFIFLTAIWQFYGQLWTILEGTANVNHCVFYNFDPKVTGSIVTRLSLLELKPGPLRISLQCLKTLGYSLQRSMGALPQLYLKVMKKIN